MFLFFFPKSERKKNSIFLFGADLVKQSLEPGLDQVFHFFLINNFFSLAID